MESSTASKNKPKITQLTAKCVELSALSTYFSDNFSSFESDKVNEKLREAYYWILEMQQKLGMKITLEEDE